MSSYKDAFTCINMHIASWDYKTGLLLLVKHKVHICTYLYYNYTIA